MQPDAMIDNNCGLFVVSVCDGIGAAFVALFLLGYRAQGIAVENEGHLSAFGAVTWPSLTQDDNVLSLSAADAMAGARAAKAHAVLLVGGPPCPPFSSLSSNPQGFNDERSAPLVRFVELRDEIGSACAATGMRFRWLMEEVATMEVAHRAAITELVGEVPTLIHAADFGYLHRARLYWGLHEVVTVGAQLPRVEILPEGTAARGMHVVRWLGRPSPAGWQPHDGAAAAALRPTVGVCPSAALLLGTRCRA